LLDDVVESFLDSVTEREFDAPFMALLRAHGYSKIHRLHGPYEFGKDIIAQRGDPRTQFAFQTKAGDIGLGKWTSETRGQVDVLRTNDLAHPDFDTTLPRVGMLVLTGRLVGGAALEAQNYKKRVDSSEEPTFDFWDRERLVELLTASPGVGLTGFADGPFLELLGRIDQRKINESQVERFSERWIGSPGASEWRASLEAALVANRLRLAERLDLAASASLCLLRAIWTSAHGEEPPAQRTLERRDTAVAMFLNYACEVWQRRTDGLLDPADIIRDDLGVIVTYPVQCLRLVELLGTYGLAEGRDPEGVAKWLVEFIAAQPGAAHPISDRWAVSLIPAVILIARYDPDACRQYLIEVLRWMGNRHDEDGLGMAGPHAEPLEEIEYLLGSSLDHIERPQRRHSYLAAVILDLAAALGDAELYDLAYNEISALDIRPFVAIPNDDVSQYMCTGHGIDVPLNTSPNYAEYFSEGSEWRMASHHDDEIARYFLGRLNRLWDHLTLSLVTRDRHWVAGLRALLNDSTTTEDAGTA
jgi:hypothetical protein